MDTARPEQPGTPVTTAFPTRRSLREAEARAAAAASAALTPVAAGSPLVAGSPVAATPPTAPASAALPAPSVLPASPVSPAVQAFPAPQPSQPRQPAPALPARTLSSGTAPHRVPSRVARTAAPAFADAKAARRGPRKRFTALVTMTAVGGLFACAALPAYALSSTTPTAVVSQTAGSASLSLAGHGVEDASLTRNNFDSTSRQDLQAQRENATEQANYDAYLKSGALASGDDYPYFSSLTYNQGGGLSPLGYFYRECVDFVAWRLNRDAGSTSAPYKYVWSDLTPNGGNASQWLYAWRAHGWKVSTTPKVGSVAWFTGNHVAYVSKVNSDGTVLIEEYNYGGSHLYGQRIIPATDVAEYLYAPPR